MIYTCIVYGYKPFDDSSRIQSMTEHEYIKLLKAGYDMFVLVSPYDVNF